MCKKQNTFINLLGHVRIDVLLELRRLSCFLELTQHLRDVI